MTDAERETFNRELRLLATDLTALLKRIRGQEAELARLGGSAADADLRKTADRVVELVGGIADAVDEMSLIQARGSA